MNKALEDEKKFLETLKDFYESEDVMDKLIIDREEELIKKTYRTKKDVLEVGCGSGYSTEKVIKIFDKFELLEPSNNNIELTKSRIKKDFTVHNCMLEEFNTTNKYSNILFLNVLEHVINPIESLKKLKTILSDDGLIYISVPNCMSLNRRAGFELGILPSYSQKAPKDYKVGHRTLYTVNMLKEHADKAGLKIVDIKGIYLKPLSEIQMSKLGMDIIKMFYYLGEDIPEYCAVLFATMSKKEY